MSPSKVSQWMVQLTIFSSAATQSQPHCSCLILLRLWLSRRLFTYSRVHPIHIIVLRDIFILQCTLWRRRNACLSFLTLGRGSFHQCTQCKRVLLTCSCQKAEVFRIALYRELYGWLSNFLSIVKGSRLCTNVFSSYVLSWEDNGN